MAASTSQRRLRIKTYSRAAHLPLHAGEVAVAQDVNSHDHDFVEIAMIFAGRALHRTLYRESTLGAGNVLVLRPGVWHGYRNCHRLRVGNCGIGLPLRQRELAWTRDDPHLSHLLWVGPWASASGGAMRFHVGPRTLGRCRSLLGELARLLGRQARDQRALIVARLLELLNELGQALARNGRRAMADGEQPHPAVLATVNLLDAGYRDAWTLDALAARVRLDRAYLVRLFKQHAGLPPMAYLNRLRLERGAGLLLQSDRPIGEIAGLVGLPDANYFARRFRQHFGCPPREFRQRQRAR